ncbi:hypothetical protein GGX14DRAFT_647961 [Mycena pura]|uniref:Uncharacterized protein n=1 Tax=Mycena pura TaxID=153505 RepID=A0AAD6Y7M0_9AGAR|nr:hypothetical protein GGX14DRAFT_647961 [Mycena pura]
MSPSPPPQAESAALAKYRFENMDSKFTCVTNWASRVDDMLNFGSAEPKCGELGVVVEPLHGKLRPGGKWHFLTILVGRRVNQPFARKNHRGVTGGLLEHRLAPLTWLYGLQSAITAGRLESNFTLLEVGRGRLIGLKKLTAGSTHPSPAEIVFAAGSIQPSPYVPRSMQNARELMFLSPCCSYPQRFFDNDPLTAFEQNMTTSLLTGFYNIVEADGDAALRRLRPWVGNIFACWEVIVVPIISYSFCHGHHLNGPEGDGWELCWSEMGRSALASCNRDFGLDPQRGRRESVVPRTRRVGVKKGLESHLKGRQPLLGSLQPSWIDPFSLFCLSSAKQRYYPWPSCIKSVRTVEESAGWLYILSLYHILRERQSGTTEPHVQRLKNRLSVGIHFQRCYQANHNGSSEPQAREDYGRWCAPPVYLEIDDVARVRMCQWAGRAQLGGWSGSCPGEYST